MLHIGRHFAFTRKHNTSYTSFFHTKIRLGNLRTLELYTLIWGIILPRIWTTFRLDMLHVELIILLLLYTLQVRLRLQWESWFLSSPPCLPSFSDSTSLYKKEALLKGKTKKKKGVTTEQHSLSNLSYFKCSHSANLATCISVPFLSRPFFTHDEQHGCITSTHGIRRDIPASHPTPFFPSPKVYSDISRPIQKKN